MTFEQRFNQRANAAHIAASRAYDKWAYSNKNQEALFEEYQRLAKLSWAYLDVQKDMERCI